MCRLTRATDGASNSKRSMHCSSPMQASARLIINPDRSSRWQVPSRERRSCGTTTSSMNGGVAKITAQRQVPLASSSAKRSSLLISSGFGTKKNSSPGCSRNPRAISTNSNILESETEAETFLFGSTGSTTTNGSSKIFVACCSGSMTVLDRHSAAAVSTCRNPP